jgi:hypothetical protein
MSAEVRVQSGAQRIVAHLTAARSWQTITATIGAASADNLSSGLSSLTTEVRG